MYSGRLERFVRSTGFKLTAWYVTVFALSLAAVGAVSEYFMARAVESKAQTLVDARLDEYRAEFEARGIEGLSRAVEMHAANGEHDVVALTRNGRTVYSSGTDDTKSATEPGAVRMAVTSVSQDVELRVQRSNSEERELLGHLRDATLSALGAALLLGLVGGSLLTRRALRPVRELSSAAETILHSGRFDTRVPTRGTGDDLDELATLFNLVLARNEALVTGMRQALDNVAHDLRTPLTRLRGGAELALKRPDDASDLREALADCVEESDRVLSMLRTLMDISAAETGAMRLEREQVDLDGLAREVVDLYDLVAEERGVRIVSSLGPVVMTGDRARLRQLLANLVDNAVKYTPAGGLVEVRAYSTGEDAVLQVRDTGIGIGPEEKRRIFERLYRGDRSRSEPGLGLGLSFVQAICGAHGGTVRIESKPQEGSTFIVTLPMQGPPERGRARRQAARAHDERNGNNAPTEM